ncbi:multidrug effflux MFS transporter [Scopulibacillus cellulosilyticus]|uniref:Bcr/CflA family efflux transporter n=1 Tax=Scopulibacillus cellulosilyticus TaxID=2665665 RepID=A0ABW2Q0Z1_9BACL
MNHSLNELDPISQPQPPTKYRRLWLAAVLGLLTAFGPFSIDMYLPSLPALTIDLHTNTSLAQLSLTACLLGLAFGQLFAGPISDKRGRKKPLVIALIIYAAASLLCAVCPSIWLLIVLRIIQGIAGSAGIVISRAMVSDLYSGTELTKFYSLLMMINGIAPIIAPIIGGQLLRVTSWHGVFVVLCLISVLLLVSVIFGLPETLSYENRSNDDIKATLSTFGRLITDRVFMGYTLSQGLVMAAMFAYISGSPFVLQNIYDVSPQAFSIFFAVNGLGIIIATQITGRLAGRVSEKKVLVMGLALAGFASVALLITILTGASMVAVVVSLFVVVSCVGIVTTVGFSLAMQNQSRSAGSASALLGLLPFIAGAIVAPLVGIAGSHTAMPMGIIIFITDVGSIVCFAILTRRRMTN